ncbi:MAG: hypothetical protein MUO63_22065, partial [Desulfobulbaceae bacterium]|nr:hypothetical protein [Desulfobulbaceae bacterium]
AHNPHHSLTNVRYGSPPFPDHTGLVPVRRRPTRRTFRANLNPQLHHSFSLFSAMLPLIGLRVERQRFPPSGDPGKRRCSAHNPHHSLSNL